MVVGEGFEPSKSMTADLQSAPFGRSGTPPGEAYFLCRDSCDNYSGRAVQEGFTSLRAVLCGSNLTSNRPESEMVVLNSTTVQEGFTSLRALRVKPSRSKLLILPRGEYETECSNDEVVNTCDGGGGRIRTFEVDDGRFTVCSLWPLGNPTTGLAAVLLSGAHHTKCTEAVKATLNINQSFADFLRGVLVCPPNPPRMAQRIIVRLP